ncbi:MAG: SixA phosphatase family protein [Gammaproteobacteria bacterium]
MRVYLIRHAVAFERDRRRWPDDRLRPLTPEGVRRFRKAAAGLRSIVKRVDRVLASPLARAWDTAVLLHETARWPKPEKCAALAPGRTPPQVLAALRESKATRIALVGHEPDLSRLIALCVGGPDARLSITMKKGGAAHLEFSDEVRLGQATLRWLVPPRVLRG